MSLVLLALSTFRQSAAAVARAIEAAGAGGELVVLYVVDANVGRYLVGSGLGMLPSLAQEAEQTLREQHRELAEPRVAAVLDRAAAAGCRARGEVVIGRFGLVAAERAEELRPDLIVTTRSKRPEWVLRLFGAPVQHLLESAPCPVEVV